MMYNYKRIFLYATLFMILLGLSATYASDITDDSNNVVSTQSDIKADVGTTSDDVAIKEEVKDNNNIQKTTKESVVEDKTIKKDSSINLNNNNLGDYFSIEDEYMMFNGDSSSQNTLIQIDEDINNQYVWVFDGEFSGITISTAEGVTLTNQAFEIYVDDVTFDGVTLEYTPEFMYEKAINVEGSDFSILKSNINYDPSVVDVGLNAMIHITGENSIIKDSIFTGTITTGSVDWDPMGFSDHEGLPQTVPVVIKGNHSDIINNTMIFSEKSSDDSMFPSFYGLTVSASYVNITDNNIEIRGSNGYVYTVYFTSTYNDMSNNLISGNMITGSSVHNYTAGIYLEGSRFSNNTIINNTVDVTCNVDEKPGHGLQDVVYAVVITNRAYQGANYVPGKGDVTDNYVINNTIVGSGHQIYAFEQFGGDNTLIEGNTINVNGVCANGFGVIGYNTTINNNLITVEGQTNQSEGSPDYVPPITSGIHSLWGLNSTFANNTIVSTNGPGLLIKDKNNVVTGNNITVNEHDFTIETIGNSSGCVISDNHLQSRIGVGTETTNNNDNNTYGDNFDDNTINVTLDMDSISGAIGDNVEIFAWFTDIDSNIFDGETINIYANDELFRSLTIDESAVYDEFEIPTDWYKQNITLTAKFAGKDLYNPTEVSKVVNVKIPTSIITSSDELVMTVGSDLTVSLKDIMDNDVDSTMKVYLNDELIDTAQSYTFTPSEVGNYTFNFVFDETTLADGYTYTSSQSGFTVLVEAITTTIVFDDMNVTQDKLTTINVNVQAVDSDVIVNEGIVEFTDADNNVLATANVENGVASVELSFATLGENTVTAVFKDSTKFLTSTDSAVITVNPKGKLNTNVVVNPVAVEPGVETTITANVTDENGNAVTKGKVVFKINGRLIKNSDGKAIYVTVENGQAQITYTLPMDLVKNTTYITATYSGSADYNSAKSENTYITSVNPEVVLSTPTLTARINETVTITANVTINNQPVNTGKVVIKINGKTVKDTNGKVVYALVQNGQINVNYTVPSTLKAKDYPMEFVYISSNTRVEQNSTITITE